MKILVLSKNGDALSIAQRIQNEGHTTSFHILDRSEIGDNLVNKLTFNGVIARGNGYPISSASDTLLSECKPDLVLIDFNGIGRVADYIKSKNILVLGGCRWADEATTNSSYSTMLMKQVGINTKEGKIKGEIVKVDCAIWWDGLTANIHSLSFRDEKFMNDDIGMDIGCAGTIVKMINANSKMVKEGISKLDRLLKKTSYRGPLSCTFLVTPTTLFGLKLNIGFQYNSINSFLELYRGSITKLFWAVTNGTPVKGDFSSDYSIAVKLSIPPYPNPYLNGAVGGVNIDGINIWNSKHLWLHDVCKEGKKYVSAGSDGDLLAATARGRDIFECRKRVYRTINNLVIEDKQYRTDIGLRVERDEYLLKMWGWI